MRYWFVTLLSVILLAIVLSCLPAMWAEREFFSVVKQNSATWKTCPALFDARQKIQGLERNFVQRLKEQKKFFGFARFGRLGYEDILVQNEGKLCLIGYVVEVDLRVLMLFPYTVHSVRRIPVSVEN
jgi:hypothetical protein